jgi:hypothetical protein
LGRKKKVSQKAEGSSKKKQKAKELQPGIEPVTMCVAMTITKNLVSGSKMKVCPEYARRPSPCAGV